LVPAARQTTHPSPNVDLAAAATPNDSRVCKTGGGTLRQRRRVLPTRTRRPTTKLKWFYHKAETKGTRSSEWVVCLGRKPVSCSFFSFSFTLQSIQFVHLRHHLARSRGARVNFSSSSSLESGFSLFLLPSS
jgi:hypothetical protein